MPRKSGIKSKAKTDSRRKSKEEAGFLPPTLDDIFNIYIIYRLKSYYANLEKTESSAAKEQEEQDAVESQQLSESVYTEPSAVDAEGTQWSHIAHYPEDQQLPENSPTQLLASFEQGDIQWADFNQDIFKGQELQDLLSDFLFPSIDDILRNYLTDRLASQKIYLDKHIKPGTSVFGHEREMCLRGMGNLEIKHAETQVEAELNEQTSNFRHMLANLFCDGEINWHKILKVARWLTQELKRDVKQVVLVDQLCHYCESIHLSSDGKSISEWIKEIGQGRTMQDLGEKPMANQPYGTGMSEFASLQNQSPILNNPPVQNYPSVQNNPPAQDYPPVQNYPPVLEYSAGLDDSIYQKHQMFQDQVPFHDQSLDESNYSASQHLSSFNSSSNTIQQPVSFEEGSNEADTSGTIESSTDHGVVQQANQQYKCLCDSMKLRWVRKVLQCAECKKYICVLNNCNTQYNGAFLLNKHLKVDHTFEERDEYTNIAGWYKINHCQCGSVKPQREKVNHADCTQCGYKLCLRGDCDGTFRDTTGLRRHQNRGCKFPLRSSKICGGCEGTKITERKGITKCPNSDCKVFWCPDCQYEGTRFRSVVEHSNRKHPSK